MTPATRMIIDALTPRAFWTTYRFQGHGSDDWWVDGAERDAIERGDYETRVHENAVGTFWQYPKVSGVMVALARIGGGSSPQHRRPWVQKRITVAWAMRKVRNWP